MNRRGPLDLTGKVVLVTGGNSGIGLGFAHGVASAGADVVLWGRRAGHNSRARDELAGTHGVRVLAQEVDVSDEARVDAAMQEALARFGRLDGAFANAGAQLARGRFVDVSAAAWREELATNLEGAAHTLRAAARHMLARADEGDPGGSLVVCGSLGAVVGIPGVPAYVAAKGGLAALTRALAVELGPGGVRVNMVAPGRIRTELGTRSAADQAAREALMHERNPIRRMGSPDDLAGVAVYLMSDASAYHTGDVLVVDGGLSLTLP